MGNQLTLFMDDRPAAKPHHRPHVCVVCGAHSKRFPYCSKDCRIRASEAGYSFPVADIAPPAGTREVDA